MKTSEAKEIYKLRKQIVEPVFGDIRENKGINAFLTRGLKPVKTEFNLICAANNIIRMHGIRIKKLQRNKTNINQIEDLYIPIFNLKQNSCFSKDFYYRTA